MMDEKELIQIAEEMDCPCCGNRLICPKCNITIRDEHLWIRLDILREHLKSSDNKTYENSGDGK